MLFKNKRYLKERMRKSIEAEKYKYFPKSNYFKFRRAIMVGSGLGFLIVFHLYLY
jgi:hypothetical protein